MDFCFILNNKEFLIIFHFLADKQYIKISIVFLYFYSM